MQALFNLDPALVQAMSQRMATRTACVPNYSILPEFGDSGAKNRTLVRGSAQDVMFLIGEVAANGEDGLLAVTQ